MSVNIINVTDLNVSSAAEVMSTVANTLQPLTSYVRDTAGSVMGVVAQYVPEQVVATAGAVAKQSSSLLTKVAEHVPEGVQEIATATSDVVFKIGSSPYFVPFAAGVTALWLIGKCGLLASTKTAKAKTN